MSYRSKRTFVVANEEAPPVPLKNQPHSVEPSSDQSLPASKSLKSFDPSTQKWGPFCPPTLGLSESFGYISQPIKHPTTSAEKPISSTPSPSMVVHRSSKTQSTSTTPKPKLISSKQLLSRSQPSSNPTQRSISPIVTGTSQPERKVPEAKGSQPSLSVSQNHKTTQQGGQKVTQAEKTPQSLEPHIVNQEPRKAQQPHKVTEPVKVIVTDQRGVASRQQVKASQQPFKASQQPIKVTQQPVKVTQPSSKATQKTIKDTQDPIMSSIRSDRSLTEKRAYVAPMRVTKHVVSRTPSTPSETMEGNKDETGKHSLNRSIPNFQSHVPPTNLNMHYNKLHMDRTLSSVHVEDEVMPDYNLYNEDLYNEDRSTSGSEEADFEGGEIGNSVKKSKPRRRSIVPNWTNHVEFDEKDEVIAIDSNGKRHLVRGSVQPRDVWNDEPGFKYLVKFNEFNQPLRKGGSILVSFLGDVAKRDVLCPVGVKSWRKVNQKFKGDIVKLVRAHFVIPEGVLINNAIKKRVAKSWKHHRYILKRDYFDPVTKTLEQNYANLPDGISSKSWTDLVDYWFSPQGQKLSKLGQDARALQWRFHNSGATSFANRREDLKEKKGEFSELDFYKSVYANEDGSIKEGTLSHQFMEDANAKVQENLASSSKSRIEIENDVFNELMYKGEVPKRPVNYGFGVKQSDIFGVEATLRKEGYSYVINNDMEMENLKAELSIMKKQNEDLAEQNKLLDHKFDETTNKFKEIATYFGQVLNEVRQGSVASELLDVAEAAIHLVTDDSSGNNGEK